VDAQIGSRVLDKLEPMGVLDDTVVIFTSDHGEMLGDHGRFQKAIHWSPSSLVPVVIRHPACKGGGRVDQPVELTDLTATIAIHSRIVARRLRIMHRRQCRAIRLQANGTVERGGMFARVVTLKYDYGLAD